LYLPNLHPKRDRCYVRIVIDRCYFRSARIETLLGKLA
jgi:hypothetical protein